MPTRTGQKISGRTQCVHAAVHQVCAAVAIKVHRQALEGAGHELGVAKGPRPRAHKTLRRNVPGLQNAQRREKLTPEITLPPPVTRQRTQRLNQRVFAKGLAKIAFHAPDRDHCGRVHTKTLLRAFERLAVFGQTGLAIGHTLFVHQGRHVVPNGRAKFGLKVQLFNDTEVGLQPRRVARPSGVAHFAVARCRSQLGHAGRQIGALRPSAGCSA